MKRKSSGSIIYLTRASFFIIMIFLLLAPIISLADNTVNIENNNIESGAKQIFNLFGFSLPSSVSQEVIGLITAVVLLATAVISFIVAVRKKHKQ